jgi:hypothetical protein
MVSVAEEVKDVRRNCRARHPDLGITGFSVTLALIPVLAVPAESLSTNPGALAICSNRRLAATYRYSA